MDEVTDPSLTVFVEGYIKDGLKSHKLNKIRDTCFNLSGERYNTLVFGPFQVLNTAFLYNYSISSYNYIRLNKPKRFLVKSHTFNTRFHTNVKAINRIGPHNRDILSVLVGSLLGNCSTNSRIIEGTRFYFSHSLQHKHYLFWLYDFFYSRGYCTNLKPKVYTRRLINNKTKQVNIYTGYEFNTFTFRSFNFLHNMFYKKGKKL